jgi:hypothetical protein
VKQTAIMSQLRSSRATGRASARLRQPTAMAVPSPSSQEGISVPHSPPPPPPSPSLPAPSPDLPITLGGAFGKIQGLEFEGMRLKNGRELIGNLCGIQEEQKGDTVIINARILRTTNVNDTAYSVQFEVDRSSRRVLMTRCSCVAGESAHCKHGAALYLYINEERTEAKTDAHQMWMAPSKKLQSRYPKGETVDQIFEKGGPSESTVHVQGTPTDEVRLGCVK